MLLSWIFKLFSQDFKGFFNYLLVFHGLSTGFHGSSWVSPGSAVRGYRLRFFEEEADLSWLPLQQTLMLVIRNKTMFLTPQEQSLYDLKMKKVNEADL